MKRHLSFLSGIVSAILLLFLTNFSYSQTNPAVQNIPYTQGFGTSTFTTLPAGIAAWTVSGGPFYNENDAENSAINGDATITAADTIKTNAGCYGYSANSNGRLYIQTGSDTNNGTNQAAFSFNTLGFLLFSAFFCNTL